MGNEEISTMKASSEIPLQDVEKQLSSSAVLTNDDVESLSWHELSVTIDDRSTGQTRDILHKASGIVRPGEMMALMGGSGSGKTTLLNTLAQRRHATGVVSGKVMINGELCSLATHRAVSSFVEQEDTLIGSLTVKQTLWFAARLALPSKVTKVDAKNRVEKLIESFGLVDQRDSLIGTPVQKGISGGQKRRVSVATQLITGPRVLYLDEPTSGLDSTASYEVMNYIRNIAREHRLIVIASIHQPSTKTFDLFSKVMLLSQGRTCYNGSSADIEPFFGSLGMPREGHINLAEHMLDLTNVDFSASLAADQAELDKIIEGWKNSESAKQLAYDIKELSGRRLSFNGSARGPSMPSQVITLLHRAFIKSYRDIFTYWIRLAMYMGLALMMGTVWLRLHTDQNSIQPFINAIFFGSAFMSFMAVAYVPAFIEDNAIFVKESENGICGPTAFHIANFLIGLPYLFIISLCFSLVVYWLINLQPTTNAFFTWVMWLFLDLVAAESLVVLITSIIPNFVVALALVAFINGLWMSVGGFLVSMPILNDFWRYAFHYIDYQAYVFQGMMVNEFKDRSYDCERSPAGDCHCMFLSDLESECKISGTAVLDEYGYSLGDEVKWVGIMIAIILVYRLLGWGVSWWKRT